jgi:threonine/homoserine/homoserine lactone efflux protein
MLSTETLAAFLAASVLITLAPGPDNLMVLSLGMSRGRAAGIGFGLGCAAGCATHTLWATLGIGALVLASDYAFVALKLAGAAYLIYIGILSWRHAGQAALSKIDACDASMWLYVRRGFVANAINPKVALFFVAFLPQFADTSSVPASMVWPQMLLLGAVFALQTVVVFGALGWFSGRIGEHLQRSPRIAFWLDRTVGLVFVALAMRLAVAER